MAFKVAFIAHAPDGDAKKHRCMIETEKYKLFVIVVGNQAEGLEVCKELVRDEGIHSVLLCPGFTHRDIAELQGVVGNKVGISVARGDGPSSRVAMEVMRKEGWFS